MESCAVSYRCCSRELDSAASLTCCFYPRADDGVLIVVRASRGGPFHRAMSLVMHYSGSTFDTASVMVCACGLVNLVTTLLVITLHATQPCQASC